MKEILEAIETIKDRASYWRERAHFTNDTYKKDLYSGNQRECEVVIKILEQAVTKSMIGGADDGNEKD